MVDRFEVGEIAGTHGVHGDVKIFPTTDWPRRFLELTDAYVESKRGLLAVKISHVRMDGKFVVLHLSGVDDMDEARLLRGSKILIDRKYAVSLPAGSYFIANAVYVVRKGDGKELMIPAIPDCILEINPEEGFLRVHLLPGLEDL